MELRCLCDEVEGVLDVFAGSSFLETAEEAIRLADRENRVIVFEFNGIIVRVHRYSSARLLFRDFRRAFDGSIDSTIGPHPSLELSDEEMAHDAEVSQKRDRERDAYYAEQIALERADCQASEEK